MNIKLASRLLLSYKLWRSIWKLGSFKCRKKGRSGSPEPLSLKIARVQKESPPPLSKNRRRGPFSDFYWGKGGGGGGSVHRLPKKRSERKKKCLPSDIIERTSISEKAATWTRFRCSGVLVELENMAQNFTFWKETIAELVELLLREAKIQIDGWQQLYARLNIL